MTTHTTFQVSVLHCKQTGRVLFLEAGKDVVDLLLSFLLLPVGTAIHMISTGIVQWKPLGGISSVVQSVKNLDSSFLHVDKQRLVELRPEAVGTCRSAGLLHRAPTPSKKKFQFPVLYRCSSHSCPYLSIKQGTPCEFHCLSCFREEVAILPNDLPEIEATILSAEDAIEEASGSSSRGFVRENITYLVTDSLEIMPSTTIRSIKVLNQLKIGTLADMESRDVTVSMTQVLELLQSVLTSSSCLNDVFRKKYQTRFTKIPREGKLLP